MTLLERLQMIDRCSSADLATIHEVIGVLQQIRNALEPTVRHEMSLGPREAESLLELFTSDVYTMIA